MAATVERIAPMCVTKRGIPVQSGYERMVVEHLKGAGREFVKPMRHDAAEPTHPPTSCCWPHRSRCRLRGTA